MSHPPRLTRRRLLGAVSSAALLAGCTAGPGRNDAPETTHEPDGHSPPQTCRDGTAGSDADGSAGGRAPDSWAEFGYDAGNTAAPAEWNGPCSGDVRWTFDGGTPTMNSSPVTQGGVVYGGGSGDPGGLFALDAESGEVEWEVETEGYVTSAPAVDGDTLYVGTWGKTFYAVDVDDGSVRWSVDVGHRFGMSSPTVVDDTVYVGTLGDAPLVVSGSDDEGFAAPAVLALDAETGEERWRYDEFGERDDVSASPAVVDGTVFVPVEGTLYALDAGDGSVTWQRALHVHPNASVAVRDGVVYCPTMPPRGDEESDEPHGRLLALDATSGETRWEATVEDLSLRTSPAVTDDSVYVAATTTTACLATGGGDETCESTSRGRLHAFDRETGTRRWVADVEPDTRSSPAVVGDTVYLGCRNGLSAVTTEGETVFRTDFADEVYVQSSPAVADGRVYLGASNGTLYAVGSVEY